MPISVYFYPNENQSEKDADAFFSSYMDILNKRETNSGSIQYTLAYKKKRPSTGRKKKKLPDAEALYNEHYGLNDYTKLSTSKMAKKYKVSVSTIEKRIRDYKNTIKPKQADKVDYDEYADVVDDYVDPSFYEDFPF